MDNRDKVEDMSKLIIKKRTGEGEPSVGSKEDHREFHSNNSSLKIGWTKASAYVSCIQVYLWCKGRVCTVISDEKMQKNVAIQIVIDKLQLQV